MLICPFCNWTHDLDSVIHAGQAMWLFDEHLFEHVDEMVNQIVREPEP